jgi:hypothetical protein
MNNKRRARLHKINDELENLIYEEQEAFDNMPEGIQESERGTISEEAVNYMEDAKSAIEEIINT